MLVRPGQKAFQGAEDQTRIQRAQIVPAAAETLHRARPVILDHHVGFRHERMGERPALVGLQIRSEEHTSELQSLMRISYAVFCLKKKKHIKTHTTKQYVPYRR